MLTVENPRLRSNDVSKMSGPQWQFNVCNACRYCEGYCAVFPAAELRSIMSSGDVSYLANLCHDCRDCYDACMYAPPHEFEINIPKLLAEARVETYERYSWPGTLSRLLRKNGWSTAILGIAAIAVIALTAAATAGTGTLLSVHHGAGAFYRVLPYPAMVAGGIAVALFGALVAIAGGLEFWKDTHGSPSEMMNWRALWGAAADAVTLRWMKGGGAGCYYPEQGRSSARRGYHALVLWGFLSAFVSTTLAALYQDVLNVVPPFAVLTAPVLFGTAGGVMLFIGCTGLTVLKITSDKVPAASEMTAMDYVFLAALNLVAITGLVLLVFRSAAAMGVLLSVHLGLVAVLFLTAPYGKFVHFVYRYLALVKRRIEEDRT